MVLSALSSANKSRHLARRIYYSFVPVNYRQVMVLGDILPCFEGNEEAAQDGFAIFDKDRNGDCSLEEIELTCLEVSNT
jgi:Ca2+-binding EF-hand superfamily protein